MEQQLSGSDKDNKKLSNMTFLYCFLPNKPTVGPPKCSSNSLGYVSVLNLLISNKIFCVYSLHNLFKGFFTFHNKLLKILHVVLKGKCTECI